MHASRSARKTRSLGNFECASAKDSRRSHPANKLAPCRAAGFLSTNSVRALPCSTPTHRNIIPAFCAVSQAADDIRSDLALLGSQIQDDDSTAEGRMDLGLTAH